MTSVTLQFFKCWIWITNKLTTLPAEIGQLKALLTLQIGYNLFTTFPLSVCNSKTITNLWINNNQIPSIPTQLAQLTSLYQFQAGYNLISSAPVTNLTNLWILNLRNNLLTTLPAIAISSTLRTLRVNYNNITSIPSQISSLPLTTLDISYNSYLTSLPSTFNKLTQLTSLYVTGDSLDCTSLALVAQMNITTCSGCTPCV